jgi:hypothetical protein
VIVQLIVSSAAIIVAKLILRKASFTEPFEPGLPDFSKIYQHLPFKGLPKFTKIWDFWFENKPSGNPASNHVDRNAFFTKVILVRS